MPEIKVKLTSEGYAKVAREVDKVDQKTEKATKSSAGYTKALIAIGAATVGIVAIRRSLEDVIRTGAAFQDSMTKSLAIMGDLTSTLENDLTNAARKAGKESVFSANQAADAYFFLASAGLSAEQSIAALPIVLATATAGAFDLATATDLLTDAQSALGLSSKDAAENMENMARVADVLVKANTLANATVRQFSEALTTKAGTALRIVNKSVEEGTAVLAAFADQGIKGALAGDALNIVLRDLSNAALSAPKAFERLGIEVFDSAGKMRHMADILADLEGALEGASDEQTRITLKQLKFQDRSVSYLLALVGMSDKIRDMDASLQAAGGTVEKISEKQMRSLVNQTKLVTGRIEDLKIEIFQQLEPALAAAVKSTKEWLDANDEMIKADIIGFVGNAADAWRDMGDVLGAVKDDFRDIVGLVKDIPEAFWQLGAPLLLFAAGRPVLGTLAVGAQVVRPVARSFTASRDEAFARAEIERQEKFTGGALSSEEINRILAGAHAARRQAEDNAASESGGNQRFAAGGALQSQILKALDTKDSGGLNTLKAFSGDLGLVEDAFGNVVGAMSLAEPVFQNASAAFGEITKTAGAASKVVKGAGDSAEMSAAQWTKNAGALFLVEQKISDNQKALDDWRESQIRAIDSMIAMGAEANAIRLNVRPYQALGDEIERIERLATMFPDLL
ncbi:MAG TPA: phage tail tape measure protein, partial [Polyangiales bacterium]|nr:phage tail tape measure protein [Polyangiales bacterium]